MYRECTPLRCASSLVRRKWSPTIQTRMFRSNSNSSSPLSPSHRSMSQSSTSTPSSPSISTTSFTSFTSHPVSPTNLSFSSSFSSPRSASTPTTRSTSPLSFSSSRSFSSTSTQQSLPSPASHRSHLLISSVVEEDDKKNDNETFPQLLHLDLISEVDETNLFQRKITKNISNNNNTRRSRSRSPSYRSRSTIARSKSVGHRPRSQSHNTLGLIRTPRSESVNSGNSISEMTSTSSPINQPRRNSVDYHHHTYNDGTTKMEFQDLYCPLPLRNNTQYNWESFQNEILTDLCKKGILEENSKPYKRIKSSEFMKFVFYCYPKDNKEGLSLLFNWFLFVFIYDDVRDQKEIYKNSKVMGSDINSLTDFNKYLLSLFKDGQKVEKKEETQLGKLALLIHEQLNHDLSSESKNSLRDVFLDSIHEYFSSHEWEDENHRDEFIPAEIAYVDCRQYTSAVWTVCYLGALTRGINISTDSLLKDSFMKRAFRCAANIIGFMNDLFSFPKELIEGHHENLVMIIQRERKIPIEEAIKIVVEKSNQEVNEFLRTKKMIENRIKNHSEENQIKEILEVMELVISGHLQWSKETPRYNKLITKTN